MAIDTSGQWWVGTGASDVVDYLRAYVETTERMEFRPVTCLCGNDSFRFSYDDDEGVGKRICTRCKKVHFLGDSEELWDETEPVEFSCIDGCTSKTVNLGAAFQLRESLQDVFWVYVGYRCTKCGVLGSCIDWKVNESPSLQFLDQM